eukprot:jgi/Hompol1/3238/HPOL_003185-RA
MASGGHSSPQQHPQHPQHEQQEQASILLSHIAMAPSFSQESTASSASSQWSQTHVQPASLASNNDSGSPQQRGRELRSSRAASTTSAQRPKPQDFAFGGILGEGSYSTVLHAREHATGLEFAVKMLDKAQIVRERKTKYVTIEKDVLGMARHPFIIRMYCTLQDAASLYYVLELAQNGDLLALIRRYGRFDLAAARFYLAEILIGIEYLHSIGVIHRDIKPENVLLDDSFHIKITDFGTAKITPKTQTAAVSNSSDDDDSNTGRQRRASFVGTAEYCSPELLNDRAASEASDIWAIGCILFQMLVGRPPFKGSNEYQTFQRIIHLKYTIPPEIQGPARNLIEIILNLDPQQRPTIAQIKQHPFFEGFDWTHLEKQTAPTLVTLEPLAVENDIEVASLALGLERVSIGTEDDDEAHSAQSDAGESHS